MRRRHPATLEPLFEADDALAARLLYEDRSFVYSHFEVARVLKRGAGPEAGCDSSFAGRS